MTGLGLLLSALPGFALDPAKTVYQYNCRTWGRQSGLPANGIRALAQTKDGYLWLGTQKGLVRFDGIEFTLVDLPNERQFRKQDISGITSARAGGLWFGIDSGAFGFYDGSGRFSWLKDQTWITPDIDIRAIREVSDGSLWVGTGKGSLLWRQDTGARIFTNEFSVLQTIYDDSEGRVWLGTAEDGLFYWQDGELHPFPSAALKGQTVFSMTSDRQGRLWVGTQFGLHCFNTHDANFRPLNVFPLTTEAKALLTDRNGSVWIGTTGDGLIRFQDGAASSLRYPNGLSSDFITSLAEDSEGNIWVGTREGLNELSDVKFPIYSRTEGVLDACHAVCASAKGGIWASTANGISYLNGTRSAHFSLEAGLSQAYVKQIFEASNGDLYLINGQRQIEILAHGKVVARYSSESWPTAITEDAHGVVISVGDSLFRASRTNFVPFTYLNGKAPEFHWVRNLYGCRDGSLLIASVNGVYRIDPDGAVERWAVEDGLPDYDVLWVSEDDEGTIWAGLQMGIARIKGRRARAITRENGLADNSVHAIMPDKLGDVWMASSRGIFRVSRRDLDAVADGKTNQLRCALYDGLEAVKTIDTTDTENSACRSMDGRIWFPSPQGAIMIDPQHIITNSVPPPVHIQQVIINGIEQLGPTSASARPGNGELEIQYTALSYVAPHKIHFRYRLNGYDEDWIDAGTRRSAFYTNLKPRKYTFQVEASNVDGVWNTVGDSFAVELPPNYYQTTWFQVTASALGVALLFGVYGWRVRHVRKKELQLEQTNEMLESKVRERTQELAEQHTLLRTLIDHLPDNIFIKDTQSRIVLDNIAHAKHLGVEGPDAVVGKTDFDFLPRELAEKFYADEKKLLESGEVFNGEETSVDRPSGKQRWSRTTKVPLRDNHGKIIGLAGINRDITERKLWEGKLEALHKQLVEISRQAGMAEVATSVLHNVGNVLNSVNVSAQLVEEKLKNSASARLTKVLALLREHEENLAHFLTNDERGKQVVAYLEVLSEHLAAEKNGVLQETAQLVRNIEHIKGIVAMQQTYARVAGVLELVKPSEVVEDALQMHALAYERHGVRVVREYSQVPSITVDRHKVIQILVNLLQNAKYACESNPPENRVVTVRIAAKAADRLLIQVADNGIGISRENIQRIFSHGFTTRKNGHGFGLHSGALAAKEMGGSLIAQSEGGGRGATFTLEIPLQSQPWSASQKQKCTQPRTAEGTGHRDSGSVAPGAAKENVVTNLP